MWPSLGAVAHPRIRSGGGFAALLYVLRKGREAGGIGMGGQQGGMTNEAGHFPEVCKKSVQAQAGDMAGTIAEEVFRTTSLVRLEQLGSRELEGLGRLGFPLLAGPG